MGVGGSVGGWTCSLGPQETHIRSDTGQDTRQDSGQTGSGAESVGPGKDLSKGSAEPGVWEEVQRREQASRWRWRRRRGRRRRRWACSVPVSIADDVTKMILNSPRALTASSDRCYCPQQSNTTVWIYRKQERQEESVEKMHKAVSRSRQTDRDTRESRIFSGGSGRGQGLGRGGITQVGSIQTITLLQNPKPHSDLSASRPTIPSSSHGQMATFAVCRHELCLMKFRG